MKRKIGLFTIIVSLMIGCSEIKVPQDNFYAYAGEWDTSRFPLIKPFQMFSFESENWMVEENLYCGYYNTDNNSNNAYCYSGEIYDVKRLKAFENLFLFRSYGSYGNGKKLPEGWFIVDIENRIREGYSDYKTLCDTLLSRYKITIDTLSWRTPKSYYEEFKKERFMPWFPDSVTNNTIKRKKYLSELLKGM